MTATPFIVIVIVLRMELVWFKMGLSQNRLKMMLLMALFVSHSGAVKLTVVNNCEHSVWPGLQPNGGHNVLLEGGFLLNPSEQRSVDVGASYWTGRVWGRTGCTFDPATGKGACSTGDCAGLLACNGLGGGGIPATLAQLTLNDRNGHSSYSISLVDGFNLPVAVTPVGGAGRCTPAVCASRALVTGGGCPRELRVVRAGVMVACNSACRAFGLDVFCCTNSFGSREACQPTLYSLWFKKECPNAYTYAHDDPAGDFTCSAPAELRLTFCP